VPTYAYKARDRAGKLVEATIEAESQADIARMLRDKDLFVTEIAKPKAGLSADIKLPVWMDPGAKPNARDVSLFSRQFATIIQAGLPIVQSLSILQEQADKEGMKVALRKVREDVETGIPLSDALAKHPRIFNKLYVYLVKAGEVSGNLDGILDRIADYQEKQEALKGKLKSAMTYPAVVMFIALAVTYFLLTTIVPQFGGILSDLGGELPLITSILMGISDFLVNTWFLIPVVIGGLVFGITTLYKTNQGRHIIDKILLTAPVVGNLVQKSSVASFANTFGLLLKSGVNIVESLEITKGTAGNIIIEDVLDETIEGVQRGEQISTTLKEHPTVFPPLVTSMISIGEETGAVDDMLEKVANFFEREVDEAIDGLTAALEPLLIVFLGAIVGFIVAGMFLPMFAIIGELSS
jgi:type IV pilus assembly protein PilC